MPSPRCCVVVCRNRGEKYTLKDDGISYHVFPRDPVIRQQWIDATGHRRDWQPDSRSNTICSEHFKEKCFQKFKNSRRLFVWAIPTLKLRFRPESPAKVTPDTATSNSGQDKPKMVLTGRCQHVMVPKNICTKCKKEFTHQDTDLYLGGRAKSIVAHVYDFFQYELKEMKSLYGDTIDISPFAKLRQRTSEATGVCLASVRRILKEEFDWNEKWKKKRRKMTEKGEDTSLIIADDMDETNNKCKMNCESDCDNQYRKPKVQEHGTQTEIYDSIFDINDNKIGNGDYLESYITQTEDTQYQDETLPTYAAAINDNSATMENQPEETSESQNSSLEPINLNVSQPTSKEIEDQSLDAINCRTQTELNTKDNQNNTKENDTVPMVLNIVMTEEQYYKTNKNGLQPDEEVIPLETVDVEIEFHEIINPVATSAATSTNAVTQTTNTTEDQYCSSEETSDPAVNQSEATDTQPLVTSEPELYRLIDPVATSAATSTNAVTQTTNTTEDQYCSSEETSDPAVNQSEATDTQPLVTSEPELYRLEPINPMMSQINSALVSAEPHYSGLETVNPIMSQTGSTQPLYATGPQYCSLQTINPASTQPLITPREPHYYNLEPLNPLINQINGTLLPSQPQFCRCSLETVDPITLRATNTLYTTEPRYCSMNACNPMLCRRANTHVETQPLVLTDQLYSSMHPTMSMLGQGNLLHTETPTQPLMSREPHYLSTTANCQCMAPLPRPDFTGGLNYYVLM